MAQTYQGFRVQEGNYIDYTPGTAVGAGDFVVQGDLVGIAALDIAASALGALAITGIFDAVKAEEAFASIGAPVYWDANGSPYNGVALSGCLTATATGNTFAGIVIVAAISASETVRMLLRSSAALNAEGIALADLSDITAAPYTAGNLLVADGDSYEGVAVSGDVTMAGTGAVTIAEGAVEATMIEGLSIAEFILGVDGDAANNIKTIMSGDATMDATGAVTIAPIDTATVAATGNSQGTAAAVAKGFTLVTAADATKAVVLPAAVAGTECIIKNEDSANAVLPIFPASGDAINALAGDASFDIAAKTSVHLIAYDATTWYSVPLLPS